ncbi:MarR family winged helix-turn-helix transcriptional regulator [Amnibacterium setariae]|uniref:MarR family transcriptional regulator n=1 Tax=Amnibacterium setariae TaxID=2306585 RepID=A0A3A1U1U5_9MICO|nr:MarR family winged helix-turn-helix transcriptional regulator [Amnibacterium setariae]RIX28426.1 MarR family transcriptional regulator [Amnibacterium setariae]
MASARMSADELDANLTWSIVRVARLVGQRLTDRLAEHGLNPVQFGVLAHLAVEEEMTQAALARAVLVRPQSIAPLLDGLEQRGLIARAGDRARGRPNPVRLTEEGGRALDGVRSIALGANDLSDVGLSPDESDRLNALLLTIIRATDGARPRDGDQLWSG